METIIEKQNKLSETFNRILSGHNDRGFERQNQTFVDICREIYLEGFERHACAVTGVPRDTFDRYRQGLTIPHPLMQQTILDSLAAGFGVDRQLVKDLRFSDRGRHNASIFGQAPTVH